MIPQPPHNFHFERSYRFSKFKNADFLNACNFEWSIWESLKFWAFNLFGSRFPPNFRIFGCLWWILAQNNGPLKVRKFNIPFGMYLVHAITTYRLKIVPNTTHTITVCTRYLPGTYHVHTWYANLVRAQAFCKKNFVFNSFVLFMWETGRRRAKYYFWFWCEVGFTFALV